MRFKSFKMGNPNKKPEEDKAEPDDATVTKVAGIEEKINNKIKDLEKTEQQLKGLSEVSKDPEEGDDALPKPHGPLSELTVETGDELLDEDTKEDIGNLLDETDEEVTIVEVSTKAAKATETEKTSSETVNPAETEELNTETAQVAEENEPKQEVETEPEKEDDSNSFNNLFSSEEEEVNPLANLINSLPDVTVHELLDDLQEINEIMQERRES